MVFDLDVLSSLDVLWGGCGNAALSPWFDTPTGKSKPARFSFPIGNLVIDWDVGGQHSSVPSSPRRMELARGSLPLGKSAIAMGEKMHAGRLRGFLSTKSMRE